MVERRERNKNIVLDYLLNNDIYYFKCKHVNKKIKRLRHAQVSNGLRALNEEGYIVKFNDSETWTVTQKFKDLKEAT